MLRKYTRLTNFFIPRQINLSLYRSFFYSKYISLSFFTKLADFFYLKLAI